MKLAPTKTPLVVKKMFPDYVWDISTNEKIIYLTFDDGPTPEITTWTLNQLKQYNAKATFFCIGTNIEKHPEIFINILNEGHAIGNHTQNHIKGWTVNSKAYLKNVDVAQNVIKSQTNVQQVTNLFRPPYGQITPKQSKKLLALNYKIIMWDVLSFDWDASVSKEDCLKKVIKETKKGSIIVFHDSIKASKNMQYTLPKILKYYSDKGFKFESLEN